MKFNFKILIAQVCVAAASFCAAEPHYYADYTDEAPVEILQPAAADDPASRQWQIRFADACALLMGEDIAKHAEARKILYALLDERPDSGEVLNLLSVLFKADPAARKEIREKVTFLVQKHTRSIPLNQFVLEQELLTSDALLWGADFLKNALKLYTEDPKTIVREEMGAEHVLDILLLSCVWSVERQDPELAALMRRCSKEYNWIDDAGLEQLRFQISLIRSLIAYPLFHVAQGKLEILSYYKKLRSRYLEMILKDGLDTLDPGNDRTLHLVLCAQLVSGEYRTDFIADLEKSLKKQPRQTGKTELLAIFYAFSNRYDDAIALMQTYLKNSEQKDRSMILLNAEILDRVKRWDDLLVFMDEYFKYLPEKAGVEFCLQQVRIFLKNKDLIRAAAILKHLKSFQALSGRIQILVQAQRFAEAYTLLKEQALPRYAAGERSADPQQEQAFLMTASALGDMYKDFALTEKLYLIWLKDHPEDPLILNNLAYTYAIQNVKLDQAYRMSSAALKAEPGNGAYMDTMAWILYRQKKYKEAAAAIEKAIAMFDGNDTESVEVLHHAGDIYLALGDKLQAKLYWLRALKALKDMEVQMKIKNESEIKQIQNKLNKLKEKSEK